MSSSVVWSSAHRPSKAASKLRSLGVYKGLKVSTGWHPARSARNASKVQAFPSFIMPDNLAANECECTRKTSPLITLIKLFVTDLQIKTGQERGTQIKSTNRTGQPDEANDSGLTTLCLFLSHLGSILFWLQQWWFCMVSDHARSRRPRAMTAIVEAGESLSKSHRLMQSAKAGGRDLLCNLRTPAVCGKITYACP